VVTSSIPLKRGHDEYQSTWRTTAEEQALALMSALSALRYFLGKNVASVIALGHFSRKSVASAIALYVHFQSFRHTDGECREETF
jgi:hypothetical protein